jgi:hypothetical protein
MLFTVLPYCDASLARGDNGHAHLLQARGHARLCLWHHQVTFHRASLPQTPPAADAAWVRSCTAGLKMGVECAMVQRGSAAPQLACHFDELRMKGARFIPRAALAWRAQVVRR